MSKMFDQLSDELFQVLKGSGKMLTLYDENGKQVYDPQQARRMFAEPDKMMLSIDENDGNSEIKLFLSQTTSIPSTKKLINTLRHLSTRFNVLFSVRKYGKELTPKDFAYQSLPVAESIFEALTGTTRTSYQHFGTSKLIVRHSARVNEEKRGSRTRNINALFVETASGERYRFPIIHLSGARAWTRHTDKGGLSYDTLGEHIVRIANESASLAKINKHILRNRSHLDESVNTVRSVIHDRIYEIRRHLTRLSGSRGYTKESVNTDFSSDLNEQQDINELSDLGVLLGITEDSPLYTSLPTIVLLTKGENMINNINQKFRRVVALENADDLVETLIHEYGYQQGSAWKLNDSGVDFFLPEAFAAATDYLDLTETEYQVEDGSMNSKQAEKLVVQPDPADTRDPGNKILAYAKKWVLENSWESTVSHKDAELLYKMVPDDDHPEYPTNWSPDDQTAFNTKAYQLSKGLRQLLSGSLHVTPDAASAAGAANPQAKIALTIGRILTPRAGITNHMLSNYLSKVYEKLGDGSPLSPVEKQVAAKAVELVDRTRSESVEEDVWDEADDNSDSATSSSNTIREMKELDEWFESFNPFKFLNEDPDVHVHIHDEEGVAPLDEADEPGAFTAHIDYNGQEDTAVKVYYDHSPHQKSTWDEPGSDDSAEITSVILLTGEDIMDQLDPAVISDLESQAVVHQSNMDQYDREDKADMDRDSARDNNDMDRDSARDNDNFGGYDESSEPTNSEFELDEFDLPPMGNEVDENSNDPYSPNNNAAEKLADHAATNFDIKEFFEKYGEDYNWATRETQAPEDKVVNSKVVTTDIAHYLERIAQDRNPTAMYLSDSLFEYDSLEIFNKHVKPEMMKAGFTFKDSSGIPTESVAERTLPPAHDIIPGDVPHSFMNDVKSDHIVNSQDHLTRLKQLAGM